MKNLERNERFSKPLEQMRSGIYIVTSAYKNQPAGCTCVWVSRVSFDPPLLAVNLDPSRHTFAAIKQGKRFCINIMGESGLKLSHHFGFTSGHDIKKFANVDYRRSESGSPILADAISYLDCELDQVVSLGDHMMVLGNLVDAAVQRDEPPLVYDPNSYYLDREQELSAENMN